MSSNCKQKLMVRRRHTCVSSLLIAPAEEATQVVSEHQQPLVVLVGHLIGGGPQGASPQGRTAPTRAVSGRSRSVSAGRRIRWSCSITDQGIVRPTMAMQREEA